VVARTERFKYSAIKNAVNIITEYQICHVVTCLCFVAFVGMFLSSFFSRRILYIVIMYVCMYVYVY
jgi:hypothetical protein